VSIKFWLLFMVIMYIFLYGLSMFPVKRDVGSRTTIENKASNLKLPKEKKISIQRGVLKFG